MQDLLEHSDCRFLGGKIIGSVWEPGQVAGRNQANQLRGERQVIVKGLSMQEGHSSTE